MMIRPATPDEGEVLSQLAARSEAYWGYDEAFMARFRELYRITETFIAANPTFVMVESDQILGFFSLIRESTPVTLEYFYIDPSMIGKGYGKQMWQHLILQCQTLGIESLEWVTSPQAKEFYLRMGAVQTGESKSMINDRMLPQFQIEIGLSNTETLHTTLQIIAHSLNSHDLCWAVGGSLLLNHHGIGAPARDIDLLVALEDIEAVVALLSELGEKIPWEANPQYRTRHFHEFLIGGIEVDVMAGMRIRTEAGEYAYDFNAASVMPPTVTEPSPIPYCALEDWYVLYQLIPGREEKVRMIEDTLISRGIQQPGLLDRAMAGHLPEIVRFRITALKNTVNDNANHA